MTPERIAELRREVAALYSGEEFADMALTECLDEIERLQGTRFQQQCRDILNGDPLGSEGTGTPLGILRVSTPTDPSASAEVMEALP